MLLPTDSADVGVCALAGCERPRGISRSGHVYRYCCEEHWQRGQRTMGSVRSADLIYGAVMFGLGVDLACSVCGHDIVRLLCATVVPLLRSIAWSLVLRVTLAVLVLVVSWLAGARFRPPATDPRRTRSTEDDPSHPRRATYWARICARDAAKHGIHMRRVTLALMRSHELSGTWWSPVGICFVRPRRDRLPRARETIPTAQGGAAAITDRTARHQATQQVDVQDSLIHSGAGMSPPAERRSSCGSSSSVYLS